MDRNFLFRSKMERAFQKEYLDSFIFTGTNYGFNSETDKDRNFIGGVIFMMDGYVMCQDADFLLLQKQVIFKFTHLLGGMNFFGRNIELNVL